MNQSLILPVVSGISNPLCSTESVLAERKSSLEAVNISKDFDGVSALSDVSLSLQPGQVHGGVVGTALNAVVPRRG